jgi:glycosyltransferase involved in cell wall biosynthesis
MTLSKRSAASQSFLRSALLNGRKMPHGISDDARSLTSLECLRMDPGLKRGALLMLAPVMPSNRGNGLAMRAGFFLDAYSRRFDVDLVVAPVCGSTDRCTFAQARARRVEILDVDRTDSHYALVAAVQNPIVRLEAFRRYGRPSLAASIGPACGPVETLIGDIRYDVVHVSRLYLAELAMPWILRDRDCTRIVLDCDENDALVYHRLAAMERRRQNLLAAAWAEAEAAAFARFAAAWLPKFDCIFAASHKEMKSLSVLGARTVVVPNVMQRTFARRRRRRGRLYTIVFVGTLGYAPNADAVIWFVSRVWRRLERAMHGRVRLVIVGSNPPAAVARLRSQRGIVVTGTVADVARYYRDADLAIAPLRAGGGTRVKVIEAAAHGVPLVTTSFGVNGTTFQHQADVLIADNEISFLRACLLLVRNGSLSERLTLRARAKMKREYSAAYWAARVIHLASCPTDACRISAADEKINVRGIYTGEQSRHPRGA